MRKETPWVLYLIHCPQKNSKENNYLHLHKSNWKKIVFREEFCVKIYITYIYIYTGLDQIVK